jgi:S1-C subfamily serine protease
MVHEKSRSLMLGAALVLALASTGMTAQTFTKVVKTVDDTSMFLIPELGAMIAAYDAGLTVDMVLPEDQRKDEYKSVDLQEGDIIKMMNGKRMMSPVDIKDAYEALSVDDEVKLGIKRGQSLQIVSFPKGDIKDTPQVVMVTSGGPGGCAAGDVPVGANVQQIKVSGDNVDMEGMMALIGLGLLLKEAGGHIVVDQVLPNTPKGPPEDFPVKGDIIKRIQGKDVSSSKELAELFKGIKTSETMTLTFSREGKSLTSTFAKPEAGQGKMIMKTK